MGRLFRSATPIRRRPEDCGTEGYRLAAETGAALAQKPDGQVPAIGGQAAGIGSGPRVHCSIRHIREIGKQFISLLGYPPSDKPC